MKYDEKELAHLAAIIFSGASANPESVNGYKLNERDAVESAMKIIDIALELKLHYET
jgi:hypothetical protein